MNEIFEEFREAQTLGSGPMLAGTLEPLAPLSSPNRLVAFSRSTNHVEVQADFRMQIVSTPYASFRLSKAEGSAWVEIFVCYWKAMHELVTGTEAGHSTKDGGSNWSKIYELWKDMTNALIRGYSNAGFEAWTVPCLYVAGKHLRVFASRADEEARSKKGNVTFSAGYQDDAVEDTGKNDKLEDAARVLNRIFTLCISDRAPLEESRKWGIYYATNLLFKTYFKLNSIGLSKNILRALDAAQNDLPPMDSFPKSHIVTFKYYVGVILFLEEEYAKAEEHLTDAWKKCHKDAKRNQELILTYLIPTHLLTTNTLPSPSLLAPYPHLQTLFTPLATCIKRGDLYGFDAALSAGEEAFVKRRIYLTLERGRDTALRNLLRKVYLAGEFVLPKDGVGPAKRRTRVPVAEFGAAIRLGSRKTGDRMDTDEIECLLANMIYKNLMKGYISREHGIVVLSNKGIAFPGTGV
ncbi:MAG: COP9 signalosome (CSN) subunit [Thelocarpon superellum]|nr:MAG: COP9 signalosome (CSN) subunit [Thelocarpon superellum]